MAKAKDAFRTISEVAEWLDTPTHVLRFWESKFSQIKPVKGAGGRRYYRPEDMDLLGGIKQLLHEDGLTIKGAQKLLREKGVKHVAMLGASITVELATPDMDQGPARPVASDAPTPHQDNLPFDTPSAAPGFTHHPAASEDTTPVAPGDLPPLPDTMPAVPGRLLGRVPADLAGLQARAAEIAPLVARLENLRARMCAA
ncbi:MerR family transcriptional regulator [Yoonia sp.]|uniref:MerR family transcriptional regulator n=1 Tax=Yoonia sp. TaxID=2212373 RepID=UPI003F6C40B4